MVITGQTHTTSVYIKCDNEGYPYAAAAYKAAKDNGIKPVSHKGKPTPYGNIGQYELCRKAVQLKDLQRFVH